MAHENNKWADGAGNGYWNDPDMLTVGLQGLSVSEQRSEFSLWVVMTSPLFLSNDPRKMSAEEKSLVTNATAIAINQDPTEQGRLVTSSGLTEVWVKHLKHGNRAVLLLNLDKNAAHTIRYTTGIGKNQHWQATDVFENKVLGSYKQQINLTIEKNSSVLLLLKQL